MSELSNQDTSFITQSREMQFLRPTVDSLNGMNDSTSVYEKNAPYVKGTNKSKSNTETSLSDIKGVGAPSPKEITNVNQSHPLPNYHEQLQTTATLHVAPSANISDTDIEPTPPYTAMILLILFVLRKTIIAKRLKKLKVKIRSLFRKGSTNGY